jgi:hypothetical protein
MHGGQHICMAVCSISWLLRINQIPSPHTPCLFVPKPNRTMCLDRRERGQPRGPAANAPLQARQAMGGGLCGVWGLLGCRESGPNGRPRMVYTLQVSTPARR